MTRLSRCCIPLARSKVGFPHASIPKLSTWRTSCNADLYLSQASKAWARRINAYHFKKLTKNQLEASSRWSQYLNIIWFIFKYVSAVHNCAIKIRELFVASGAVTEALQGQLRRLEGKQEQIRLKNYTAAWNGTTWSVMYSKHLVYELIAPSKSAFLNLVSPSSFILSFLSRPATRFFSARS